MKYLILLADGMADYPAEELGKKTPLEIAQTPNMDILAKESQGGYLRTIPPGMGAGSDVANLSILGYDPALYYTGRGPLEAASVGVELKVGETAFRCNLITVKKGRIIDYSAGHISSEESAALIEWLNKNFHNGRFYPGVSYRNLFVTPALHGLVSTPPHDVTGGLIDEHLLQPASDPDVQRLNRMMLESEKILKKHPVNLKRKRDGRNPGNMIWLWGQGVAPSLTAFHEKNGVKGAIISAVDLIKGIGIYAGMDILDVDGATGLIDTNWKGKALKAVDALENYDLVYVHVEAIDEASHAGDVELKIKAIEAFDKYLVGEVLDTREANWRIAILPDHYTPCRLKTHTDDPVPFIVSGKGLDGDGLRSYTEKEVKEKGSLGIRDGHDFMKLFLCPGIR